MRHFILWCPFIGVIYSIVSNPDILMEYNLNTLSGWIFYQLISTTVFLISLSELL